MVAAAEIVRLHAETLSSKAGLDLVAVEVKGSGARTLVRVKVDRKGGVDLEQCRQLSRDLGKILDDEDPIDSRYQLEVTSPGVNHPLQTQRDFDRVEGRLVAIRRTSDSGGEQIKGTVREAAEAEVLLDVEGSPVAIAYDDIEKATQALPW